jgi:hypothetical protein
MRPARVGIRVALFVFVLPGVMTPRLAHAQSRPDCSVAGRPGIGLSAGRSLTPYVELSGPAFGGAKGASIQPRGGLHLAARLDVPIAGAWRGRLEVSGANWPVERLTYDASFQPAGRETVGRVEARQIVALVGRQGGRSPACGYVLAGGGLYSLRGALQLDAQVHVIQGAAGRPIASSGTLAASLSVGWLHRF